MLRRLWAWWGRFDAWLRRRPPASGVLLATIAVGGMVLRRSRAGDPVEWGFYATLWLVMFAGGTYAAWLGQSRRSRDLSTVWQGSGDDGRRWRSGEP